MPMDSYNLWKEWGYAGNPHQTFNASVNSRMPLDVYLTTTRQRENGAYYTVTTGKDDNHGWRRSMTGRPAFLRIAKKVRTSSM